MDLSLFYFANDNGGPDGERDRYRLLLDGARFADTHDFAAIWTPERHFHPFGGQYPNPSVTSAAIATITERVGIRAGSVVAPLHHPLRIAEEWAVVDNLSGGRVGLSFASGWHAKDYSLRPENYADRKQVLGEYVQTVRELWRGGSLTVTDGLGAEQELRVYPPPVQPELPVWVTSAGGVETFRQAGKLGAGVLTHLLDQDLDVLAEKIAEYRKALAGRPDADSWPGHVALMIHTYLDDDPDAARELVRAPLTEYMRSAMGLMKGAQLVGNRTVDMSRLSDEDTDFLLDRAFDRYVGLGMLGTVGQAVEAIGQFAEIGVDEVACLIDFGLPPDAVLAALPRLDQARREVTP